MIKKIPLLFVFAFGACILFAQDQPESKAPKLILRPIIGFTNQSNNNGEGFFGDGMGEITSPLTLGIAVRSPKLPLSVSYQFSFLHTLMRPIPDSITFVRRSISSNWVQHTFLLNYQFKHFYIGAGGYLRFEDNSTRHIWYDIARSSGFILMIGKSFNIIDIELGLRSQIQPSFNVLDRDYITLGIFYNGQKASSKPLRKLAVNALIGARFFSTQNIELLPREVLYKVGVAPMVGLEIRHKKSSLSLNLERDWWLSLNGGSPARDVKGYINTSFVGLGYHYRLPNERFLRVKVGGSFILDYNRILNEAPVSDPNLVRPYIYYQAKGIGAAISYEILPKTDIEIRHTFTTIGLKDEGPFDIRRLSAGIVFRVLGE
jgi:hypothetical protein